MPRELGASPLAAAHDVVVTDSYAYCNENKAVQKVVTLPKPICPVDLALLDPQFLSPRHYISTDYISLPMQAITLLLQGRAFYSQQNFQAYVRDIELFLRLNIELGAKAFRLNLDEMYAHLSPETADLLTRQRRTSKLRMLGWLSAAPNKDFLGYLRDVNQREIHPDPNKKGTYKDCVDLPTIVADCPEFTQPITDKDTLFGIRGSAIMDVTEICNILLSLANRGLSPQMKEQARKDAQQHRVLSGKSGLPKPDDGEVFYNQFQDVLCKSHVVLRREAAQQLLVAFLENPVADVCMFMPLYLLAYSENKPHDELAPSFGTICLALGRQGNATTYCVHKMKMRTGTLWGPFIAAKLYPKTARFGKRPGFYCFFEKMGQTVRGKGTGLTGANYDARVFLLTPANFGLPRELLVMYQNADWCERVYREHVRENVITKPWVREKLSKGREAAVKFSRAVFAGIKDTEQTSKFIHGGFIHGIELLVKNELTPCIQNWADIRNKPQVKEGIKKYKDLGLELATYLEDPSKLPTTLKKGFLVSGRSVYDDDGSLKRAVVKQADKSELFDVFLNKIIQAVLIEANERLDNSIHNFLPGTHATSSECATRLQLVLREMHEREELFGIFNLDVKKCFDSIDFSNPNILKWLDLADQSMRDLGIDPFVCSLTKQIMDDFVQRILNGSYQHDSLTEKGKVRCGLILLPVFWVYLTLPLTQLLQKQRENGHLHFVSVCGDDFFAVTKEGISLEVRQEVESVFNSFASDLGFEYHYFKNYQPGQKGDTKPERFQMRRATKESPWEVEWPRHLPLVHASIRFDDLKGLQAPSCINRISKDFSEHALRSMIYQQLQISPYQVSILALMAAGLIGSDDTEKQITRKMATDFLAQDGEQRWRMYGPGLQASVGYLLLEIENNKSKWLQGYTGYEEVAADASSEESVALDHPVVVLSQDKTEPDLARKLLSLKDSYLQIWKSPRLSFSEKNWRTENILKRTMDCFPKEIRVPPFPHPLLKNHLADDDKLLLGYLMDGGPLFAEKALPPGNLKKLQTNFQNKSVWVGAVKGRRSVLPLAYLLTQGWTSSISHLSSYQHLDQMLKNGTPLVPKFNMFFDSETGSFSLSNTKRGCVLSDSEFKRDMIDTAFQIERYLRDNARSRVENLDVTSDDLKVCLSSLTPTRYISDTVFEMNFHKARTCLSQGNLETAMALCDAHSLREVEKLYLEFLVFCNKKSNKKLIGFLEDLRSRPQEKVSNQPNCTSTAWKKHRESLGRALTWFKETLKEELETRETPQGEVEFKSQEPVSNL